MLEQEANQVAGATCLEGAQKAIRNHSQAPHSLHNAAGELVSMVVSQGARLILSELPTTVLTMSTDPLDSSPSNASKPTESSLLLS